MDGFEEIREKISQCDDKIIEALTSRMNLIKDIITDKKHNQVPNLYKIQEREQLSLTSRLDKNPFEDEILDIFTYIVRNSKKVQAKSLFSYNIMLIGFMGTGKSTVSTYLSELFAMESVDIDQLIVEKESLSISDIFNKYGEEYFRNCESNILIELQKKNQLIVSCGGGVVLRDENIAHMKKNGRIVLLTGTPQTIFERVKNNTDRPILNDNMNVEYIESLMEKRRERYMESADIVISTDHKSIPEICEEIIRQLSAIDCDL